MGHLLLTVSFIVKFGSCLNSCAILFKSSSSFFSPSWVSVLVALYEQQEKPNNALEYPFTVYAEPETVAWSSIELSLGLKFTAHHAQRE